MHLTGTSLSLFMLKGINMIPVTPASDAIRYT